MIRVRNGKTLRRISRKILKASGGRNIIAMTAIAFEEDIQTALAAGMIAHMAKPIDMAKLKETLTHARV